MPTSFEELLRNSLQQEAAAQQGLSQAPRRGYGAVGTGLGSLGQGIAAIMNVPKQKELQEQAHRSAELNDQAQLDQMKINNLATEEATKTRSFTNKQNEDIMQETSALERLTNAYSSGMHDVADPHDVFRSKTRYDLVEKDLGNGMTGLMPVARTVLQERKQFLDQPGNEDLKAQFGILPAHQSYLDSVDKIIQKRRDDAQQQKDMLARVRAGHEGDTKDPFMEMLKLSTNLSKEIRTGLSKSVPDLDPMDYLIAKSVRGNNYTYEQFVQEHKVPAREVLKAVGPQINLYNALMGRMYPNDPEKLGTLTMPTIDMSNLSEEQANAVLSHMQGLAGQGEMQLNSDLLSQTLKIPPIKVKGSPIQEKTFEPPPQTAGQQGKQAKEVNQDLIPAQRDMESDQDFMDRVVVGVAGGPGKALNPTQKAKAKEIFNAKRKAPPAGKAL